MATVGDTSFGITEKKPKGSASLAAVLSAFLPTWIVGLVFLAIFVLIRQRYTKIYAPRTFMGTIPEKNRTPAPTGKWFDWLHTMIATPDKFILLHQSLDSYLFLRFLRTIIFICLVGCVLTWPILMPVNAKGGGQSTELDKLGIGNIQQNRFLYAHAVMAWVFLGFVMFTVARERLWLIGLRQAWKLSQSQSTQLSSRTVLYLSAPRDSLDESKMKHYFGDAAVRIWPAVDVKDIQSMVSNQDSMVEQLEGAEMSLILKADQYARKHGKRSGGQYENLPQPAKTSFRPRRRIPFSDDDTITRLRRGIRENMEKIDEMRNSFHIGEPHGAASVFVEFKSQFDAQLASQQVISTNPAAFTPRYTDVPPSDIIWPNLTLSPPRRAFQAALGSAIVSAIILFWSIPSGFVGLASNISYLSENFKWLGFLKGLPDPAIGLLSGLLPPLVTSALTKFVPNIFRFIFEACGTPSKTANELKVQKWFYLFQVTQVFLVTAVFSGAATVASELLEKLQNPTSVPELLARELPKSSNFYLTYFILQGTTSAADNILNYTDLLQYLIYSSFIDKTPRKLFNRFTSMKGIAWGKVFPKFANFCIIAIAYSCISPLVMGFAAAGLSLYYFSYRYNLLFVIQSNIDTKGQSYTLALQHLLTGVYIAELALIGIFGLRNAPGPLALLILLLIATITYHFVMNKYLAPLEKRVPLDLVNSESGDQETAPLLSAEEGESTSQIQRLGERMNVPQRVAERVIDPLAQFFEPHIFASCRAMKRWLEDEDGSSGLDEVQRVDEDDIQKAYLNPALTSAPPTIWLARDHIGATSHEITELKEEGLEASDEGAWIDDRGRIRWDMDTVLETAIL
ncbi:hypothetical protein B0I35DRAFT_423605 [Stachybotrys elegans]|uniref:CSC1/OSCA1-like 7TM region domain-containing protein n=1 Tax=Stachybotrys elegans TaxID=80388 RepID=A0A8K0WUL4_9HYPO|nr:hypothetical protein B0I35DRAFT_423605 [Stachybotrys elegans]